MKGHQQWNIFKKVLNLTTISNWYINPIPLPRSFGPFCFVFIPMVLRRPRRTLYAISRFQCWEFHWRSLAEFFMAMASRVPTLQDLPGGAVHRAVIRLCLCSSLCWCFSWFFSYFFWSSLPVFDQFEL